MFTLIGVAVLLLAPGQISITPTVQTRTTPALIPNAVAVACIITGLAMVGVAFFGLKTEKPARFEREGTIRVAGSMLLLLAYTHLFSVLGFVVTSAVFLALFSYIFGARSVAKVGLAAAGIPVAVWLLFEHLFRVPLPHGLLF